MTVEFMQSPIALNFAQNLPCIPLATCESKLSGSFDHTPEIKTHPELYVTGACVWQALVFNKPKARVQGDYLVVARACREHHPRVCRNGPTSIIAPTNVRPTALPRADSWMDSRSRSHGMQPDCIWLARPRRQSSKQKLRDECLNGEFYYSLRAEKVVIAKWRFHCNTK